MAQVVTRNGKEYFWIDGRHYERTGPNTRSAISEETVEEVAEVEADQRRWKDIEAAFPLASTGQQQLIHKIMQGMGMDADNVRDLLRTLRGLE